MKSLKRLEVVRKVRQHAYVKQKIMNENMKVSDFTAVITSLSVQLV